MTILGAILAAIGFALSSFVKEFYLLYLTFGIVSTDLDPVFFYFPGKDVIG